MENLKIKIKQMVSVMEPLNLDKLRVEMGRMVNSDVLFKVSYGDYLIAMGSKNIQSNFAHVYMTEDHCDNYDLEDYIVRYIEQGF